MRRMKLFIFVILLMLPLVSFSPYTVVGGTILKNEPGILPGSSLPPYQILKEIVVLPDGKFNRIEAQKMIATLANIHPNLLRKIADKQIYIKFFKGKLTDEPTARHLRGKKPRGYTHSNVTWDDVPGIGGSNIVLVKIGHNEKGKGHGSVNLELHELAHSVDHLVFGGISTKSAFLAIWQQEANQLFPGNDYFLNYPEEYFAETFAMYYNSLETRQHLQSAAPRTYEFMKSLER